MKPELLKNKIAGLLFILLGIVSIFVCNGDATFFGFALIFGIGLLFMDKPVFYSDIQKKENADESD